MAAVVEHMTLSEYICQKQKTTCTVVMGHSLTYMLPMQIAIQEGNLVQPAVAAVLPTRSPPPPHIYAEVLRTAPSVAAAAAVCTAGTCGRQVQQQQRYGEDSSPSSQLFGL